MHAINIIVFSDLHIADRAPSGRVDAYLETILGKLEAIGKIANDAEATAVLSLGDIFHIKQGNRVSDYLRQRLIMTLKDFSCPVYVVPGNHDYGPGGLDSLEKQPLGTLEKAGAITIARELFRIGNAWIVPRPYNAEAEGVHTGECDPAHYSITAEEAKTISADDGPVIGVAHASVVGPGDSRQYPTFGVDKIPGLKDYDVFLSGHLHECLGTMKVGTTIFANPGSVARTRRDIASYARTVQVLKVSINDGTVEVSIVPIPGVLPATEVFGRREPDDAEPEMNSDSISNFVELLGKGIRADEVSLPELLSNLSLEPAVKAEVQKHLEAAS